VHGGKVPQVCWKRALFNPLSEVAKMNLKIGKKLGLGFGVILALMCISGAVTYWKITAVGVRQTKILEVRVPTINIDLRLSQDLNWSANKSRQFILAGDDPAKRESAKKLFDEVWVNIDKDVAQLTELAPRWTLQENRDRLAHIKAELAGFREAEESTMSHAVDASPNGIVKAGAEFSEKATTNLAEIKKTLAEIIDSQEKLLQGDKNDITSMVDSLLWILAIMTAVALIIGIVLAVIISRQISSATNSVLHQAEAIADGDLTGDPVKVSSRDELGELATSINAMQANLRKVIQSISENSQNVANASEEFSSVSQQITANSEETSAQANAVSSATDQVNRNLQTVATATEEMSASISEIAKNATEAARVAGSAMETATETNAIVSKLGESSAEIGQVIKVITSIAQKTDLLALNATVEAARAGEVGAGFAVVANEVKELAKQTANATEDISRKIETIQTDAKAAVQAIGAISGIISQVNQISGTIAAAVEEQSATASEMSRNLTDAAKGSGEVAQNINGVAQAAQNTSQGATDSLKAAQQLAKMSTQLRGLVEQFKLERNDLAGRRSRGSSTRGYAQTQAETQQEEEALVR
jgi:methyl-accepting chemotaxis protein